MGERIKSGESVLLLEKLASTEECQHLMDLVLHSHAPILEEEKRQDQVNLLRIPTRAAAARAANTKTPCAHPLNEEADYICQSRSANPC